jgi:isoquinoline 1-oxidoreductase subunit alpha
MKTLNINGRSETVDVEDDAKLLWVLRDELGHMGTKFGCGMALCGACTVLLDGEPIRSCVTPISAVGGRRITTIEGLERDRVGRIVQDTWVAMGVAQCGYCQAGQINSATALLKKTPKPTEQQAREAMSGNICRCGTYTRINAAIRQASVKLAGGKA